MEEKEGLPSGQMGEGTVSRREWSTELNAMRKRTAGFGSMEVTLTRAVLRERWWRHQIGVG